MATDPRDQQIAELKAVVRELLLRVEALERENAELRARLGLSSRNSSQPPSKDTPDVERPKARPTGKKRGGQPGHQGANRERLAADEVVEHKPSNCRACERPLSGDDPDAKWCQVLELPHIQAHVTEHRAHALKCRGCGTVTSARLPDEALVHGFGPRLTATVAYLTGRCRLSKRQVTELCADLFGTPVSTGAVCALEQDVAAALKAPVEEARAAVKQASSAHADETGWMEGKARAWLWVLVTRSAIVFHIARSRGSEVAKTLLGEQFAGLLISDRWSGYNWVDPEQRQVCWAHLLRDLQGMVDRGGVGGRLAKGLLTRAGKMFDWWARVREGQMQRKRFRKLMEPIQKQMERLFRRAARTAEPKTAGMCREILKLEPALWTFVEVEGIEPTNNAAERAIRPAVLWRKGCFGTDSEGGSRFVERILTAVATVRLHQGNVLEYLTRACVAFRQFKPVPSLLPAQIA